MILHQQKITLSLALTALLATAGVHADERLNAGYSLGLGLGSAQLSGDYVRSSAAFALGGGLDYTGPRSFLVAHSFFATNDASKGLDIALGFSPFSKGRFVKIGLGFDWSAAAAPAEAGRVSTNNPAVGGFVQTDPSRQVETSVSSIGPYLRLTPWHDRQNLLNLDLFYGIKNWGQEKLPVTTPLGAAYLVTDPLPAGGAMGTTVSYSRRLGRLGTLGVSYYWRQSRLDGGAATIQGDFLGGYAASPAPNLTIRNQALLVNFVVTD